jgi:hypothetical protein
MYEEHNAMVEDTQRRRQALQEDRHGLFNLSEWRSLSFCTKRYSRGTVRAGWGFLRVLIPE